MAVKEAARQDGIDVVAIVTPNHVHHAAACAFLDAGIHVICDKPLTATLADARDLVRRVEAGKSLFGLTHNYTGYPMSARHGIWSPWDDRCVRVVQVEYPQDWLATRLEETGHKQAAWRTDPARSGPAGCLGDIGTHAFNLAEFVTGLHCERVAADLSTFVPGRPLDDNAHLLLRFPAACAACSGRARLRLDMRMVCACVSMASKARWPGCRNIPTSCMSRNWAKPRE